MAVIKDFGSAGNRFVLEEQLTGPEISVLAITDGRTILTLPPAQDHNARSTMTVVQTQAGWVPIVLHRWKTKRTMDWIEAMSSSQQIHTMKRSRHPFRGILYAA